MAKEKAKVKGKGKLTLEVLTPEKVVIRDSEIDIVVVKAPEPEIKEVQSIKIPETDVPVIYKEGRDQLKAKAIMGQKELPETMREDVTRIMDDKPGAMRDDVPRVMDDDKPRVMRKDAPGVMGDHTPPMADLPEMPEAPPMADLPEVPEAPSMAELPERPTLPTLAPPGELPPLPKLPELPELPEPPVVPRALREIGIMSGHAPMLVRLPISPVRYKKGKEIHWLVVAGGFLEVRNNKVTILSFGAEKVDEKPDADLAIEAKKRVESWLLEGQVGGVAFDEKAAEADIKISAIELYKSSSSAE